MSAKYNIYHIIEKIIGAITILISSYYLINGVSAWDSLFIMSHIQGTMSKILFVAETIINYYLIPLIVITLGLLYVNMKINKYALWLLIINYVLLLFMIIVQNMNIKSYLLLVVVNSSLLTIYIVHKRLLTKHT